MIYARLSVPPVHVHLGQDTSNDTSTDLGQDTSKDTDLGQEHDTWKDTWHGPPSQERVQEGVLAFDHVQFSVAPFAPWLRPHPGRAADVTSAAAPSRGGGGGGGEAVDRGGPMKKRKRKRQCSA